LYDEYDPVSKTSSMARTTGYTCTAAVNIVLNNLFNEKGVFPPELIGRHEICFSFILNYLKERNIIYKVIEI
jgi:saccharopine dehydrogenase-like NADP-dependent oxidoreductase